MRYIWTLTKIYLGDRNMREIFRLNIYLCNDWGTLVLWTNFYKNILFWETCARSSRILFRLWTERANLNQHKFNVGGGLTPTFRYATCRCVPIGNAGVKKCNFPNYLHVFLSPFFPFLSIFPLLSFLSSLFPFFPSFAFPIFPLPSRFSPSIFFQGVHSVPLAPPGSLLDMPPSHLKKKINLWSFDTIWCILLTNILKHVA